MEPGRGWWRCSSDFHMNVSRNRSRAGLPSNRSTSGVRGSRPGCPECGVLAHLKDRRVVNFVDLPCFGKPTTLS